MATQSERREKTRAALLNAARKLFLEKGFAETSTAMILTAAGVSKGALYHHFDSKDAILEAIYLETSANAIAAAGRAVDERAGPLDRLKMSARAWLEEICVPETARILLDLGPRGLGGKRAKALEDEGALAALTTALRAAKAAGEIDPPSLEIAARMLNTLLGEAALVHLEQGEAARAAVDQMIDGFIESLRVARPGSV